MGASPNEPAVGPLSGSWAEESDDLSGGDPEVLVLSGDAIVSGHPAELLALASTLVEDLDEELREAGRTESDGGAELTWPDVVGELLDEVRPETTALLHALRVFAPEGWAGKIAEGLARRPTPSLPAWISSIGEADVTGVWSRSVEPVTHADSEGDSGAEDHSDTEDVFVGVRWPTGQELTLIVHVDRHPVAVVHDVLLARAGVEAVKEVVVAEDGRTTFVRVDPIEARGRLIPAVQRWETTEPVTLSDDWPSKRPLLLWLLSTLPDDGSESERAQSIAGQTELHPAVAALADRLPIGDEPIEVSVRWASIDAELRGVGLGDALVDRITAHAELVARLDAWNATITEIDDGAGFRDAVAVAADADTTFALLTACNPMTVELSDDENDRRNRLLLAEIDPALPSVGRSIDGSWSELGFAMPMGPAAVESAQRFGQAAIFVVSPGGREVLVLVGAAPSALVEAAG